MVGVVRWAPVPMLMLLVACELPMVPGACTDVLLPGIVVEMRDARTGAPLAGLAVGVVRDGAYSDSLRPATFLDPGDMIGTMLSRQAAHERPGRYSVEVQRPGYHRWTQSDVRVRDGGCHVETQLLRAQLQPVQ